MKETAFQAAYLPVGAPTFHLPSAQDLFERSINALQALTAPGELQVPAEMLLSLDKLNAFLDTVTPNLLIVQGITFANGAYMSEILHRFPDVPVVLWTLREPVVGDGGRLRLNSLTGAYSAGNTLAAFGKPFVYTIGSPEEERTVKELGAAIRAAKALKAMNGLTLAAIGHTPQGFGFGRALDAELLSVFGVRLLTVEARELIRDAKAAPEEAVQAALAEADGCMAGLAQTPENNRHDFAALVHSYRTFVEKNHVGALASRCWPDFFTDYGTPVCAVLAMLNDAGVAASCEADVYGALSMWLGQFFTGRPAFFGDPVSLDEEENTLTFWHCGTAACSLARKDTGACVGEHCNRHIGPTMEFGTEACEKAVIFRVGRRPDGTFRFLIAEGEVLDRPKQFLGTSAVVHLAGDAGAMVRETVKDGWEPHYAVIFGDAAEELAALATYLNLPVCRW